MILYALFFSDNPDDGYRLCGIYKNLPFSPQDKISLDTDNIEVINEEKEDDSIKSYQILSRVESSIKTRDDDLIHYKIEKFNCKCNTDLLFVNVHTDSQIDGWGCRMTIYTNDTITNYFSSKIHFTDTSDVMIIDLKRDILQDTFLYDIETNIIHNHMSLCKHIVNNKEYTFINNSDYKYCIGSDDYENYFKTNFLALHNQSEDDFTNKINSFIDDYKVQIIIDKNKKDLEEKIRKEQTIIEKIFDIEIKFTHLNPSSVITKNCIGNILDVLDPELKIKYLVYRDSEIAKEKKYIPSELNVLYLIENNMKLIDQLYKLNLPESSLKTDYSKYKEEQDKLKLIDLNNLINNLFEKYIYSK
ncbi:MAG: hypothetical protein Edafosvirus13_8 [Edafosvirus sp.]|uniref:Uncharacterized protein n=1 Tax=Edafosvirus sp. TaxID=2487765 RepID=A0A3G4ZXZ8_9VIRU|nr:MAG: hypothetical protein Edafosvirus13_8 [Edafosvirus sp.]